MNRTVISKPIKTKPVFKKYRAIAPTSQVDELLFGNHKKVAAQRNTNAQAKVNSQVEKRDKIQIIGQNFIRNIRVPQKHEKSLVLSKRQFENMLTGSSILTKAERETKKKEYQMNKEKAFKDANERRKLLESRNRTDKVLAELELKARNEAKCLVEKANALKMEEEDEIKQMNQLIVEVKCHAARDCQIQEMKSIQKKKQVEEKRFQAKVDKERRKVEDARNKIEEQRKNERIRGKKQIQDQIRQHELEKQKKAEMKRQEGLEFRKKMEKERQEELRAEEKRKEEKKRLHKEIQRINHENERIKKLQKEQEKLAELRDKEHIRKKMEREAQYEAEQKRIKKNKDLEIAKMWAKQKRAKDLQAAKDELQAKRIQKVKEREWTKAETEKDIKKLMEEHKLKSAMLQQTRDKERCLAMEIGQQMTEFKRVLKATQDVVAKEKVQQERERQKAHHNLQHIQRQILDRKNVTKAKRKEVLQEANRKKEEARLIELRIEELKKKKLNELVMMGLDEKYRKEVMRKTLRRSGVVQP